MAYFRNAVRAGLAVATVAALVAGVILLVPRCAKCRQLESTEGALRAANQGVDVRIREVRHEAGDFATNALSVERAARMEGMIRPDEVVFRFTPAPTDTPARTENRKKP